MDNYLDVTRVQKALRHASNLGHDVLTDLKTAHIDGKKYGIALGHSLIIQDTNSRNLLTSHVLQNEKPVVSEIMTASTPTTGRHARSTSAWVPHPQSGFSRHDEEGSGHYGFFEENNKSTNGLWLPHPDHANSAVKDIHEHLATHNKIDTSNWHEEGRLNNINEKMKGFTHPLPVFSGFIDVLHRGKDDKVNNYVYNPETEQLIKHEDESED